MSTKEELKGQWNEVKSRLQERWGQLTENDFQQLRGEAGELVGVVQRKTGASKQEIEAFIADVAQRGESFGQTVASNAQQYAGDAQEMAGQYADEAARYAREGYGRIAEASGDLSKKLARTVRERPAESLAIAFGAGLLAGAVLLMGKRNR